MSHQLALNLRLRDGSSFENFHCMAGQEAPLTRLVALASGDASGPAFIYLWGDRGCGKSHLLEALCRSAQQRAASAALLPLAQAERIEASELPAFDDALELLALDDVHAVAGDRGWEQALVRLCDTRRVAGSVLVVSAVRPPAQCGFVLPDLVSRFTAAEVYVVTALDDGGRVQALRERAARRGLELPEDVARYVLSRYPRDTHALFALLDRLDRASLVAQRRLTIPFLRSLDAP